VNADLWTVTAAIFLPYLPYLFVAVEKQRRGIYDPDNPAASNAKLEGWSLRAKAAEVNSWEALVAYLAVSWIAHESGVDDRTLAALGGLWVATRLVYVGGYVAGHGRLRIVAWFAGVGLLLARLGLGLAQ